MALLSHSQKSDAGNASIEFIAAGALLLVPIVYLIVTMAVIQGAQLAAASAARQAARVFVQAPDLASAQAAAQRAVDFAFADHRIDPRTAVVRVTCLPHPTQCLTPLGTVTVHVSVAPSLPLVPRALTGQGSTGGTLSSSASQQVSKFWGSW